MARHLIRGRKGGPSKTSKVVVLSVYDTLTEKAAAECSSRFVAFQHELATMAGCSVSALKLALGQLVAAHLVRVETSPSHGPNTYCLLAPPNHPSVSHDVANHDSHDTATVRRKPKAALQVSTGKQAHISPGSAQDPKPPAVIGAESIPVSGFSSNAETPSRAPDPVQTVAAPTPSPALADFRLVLAAGTFRTPNGRAVAQRLIARLTPDDLTMLSAGESAKAHALMGRR
jgi:hypothetical protein